MFVARLIHRTIKATRPNKNATAVILEHLGTEVVDLIANKKVVCLHTFECVHLVSSRVEQCLNDQVFGYLLIFQFS